MVRIPSGRRRAPGTGGGLADVARGDVAQPGRPPRRSPPRPALGRAGGARAGTDSPSSSRLGAKASSRRLRRSRSSASSSSSTSNSASPRRPPGTGARRRRGQLEPAEVLLVPRSVRSHTTRYVRRVGRLARRSRLSNAIQSFEGECARPTVPLSLSHPNVTGPDRGRNPWEVHGPTGRFALSTRGTSLPDGVGDARCPSPTDVLSPRGGALPTSNPCRVVGDAGNGNAGRTPIHRPYIGVRRGAGARRRPPTEGPPHGWQDRNTALQTAIQGGKVSDKAAQSALGNAGRAHREPDEAANTRRRR
jgi:hypothetical protein